MEKEGAETDVDKEFDMPLLLPSRRSSYRRSCPPLTSLPPLSDPLPFWDCMGPEEGGGGVGVSVPGLGKSVSLWKRGGRSFLWPLPSFRGKFRGWGVSLWKLSELGKLILWECSWWCLSEGWLWLLESEKEIN